MIGYTTQASWVLSTAFTVSALDELFRSTTRPAPPGTTPRGVCDPGGPGYAAAFALAVLVRMGWPWVTWTGLRWRCTDRVSILYYSPIMLPHRQPGPIDWLEDKLSTGLLFVAVALLLDDLLGKTLTP
jgi:hypothetical protein